MAISVRQGSSEELGAELHDRVIGSMTALILEMEQFKREQYNRESVQSAVGYFQHSMRATLGELRDVVNRLQGSSSTGFDKGLVEAIRTGPLAEFHVKTGAATKITVSPQFPRRLDSFTEIQLYRVAEQALHNAALHSGANNVTVTFRVVDEYLVLQIADDGCGHNWATSFNGQGTIGMQQRAHLIGGNLEIDNRVGGGTVVRVRIQNRDWS